MDFGPSDPRPSKRVSFQRRRKDRHQEQLRAAFDPLKVRPDWKEYHKRFCLFHGGNEVEIRGKLVCLDGWSISATFYAGPEWPPPEDKHELEVLLTEYWTERKGIVLAEYKLLRVQRDELVRMCGHRSVDVPRQIVLTGDQGEVLRDAAGVVKFGHENLGTSAIDIRMKWLSGDAEHAGKMIELLGSGGAAVALEYHDKTCRARRESELVV